jgi:hypothetical protein
MKRSTLKFKSRKNSKRHIKIKQPQIKDRGWACSSEFNPQNSRKKINKEKFREHEMIRNISHKVEFQYNIRIVLNRNSVNQER